MRSLKSFFFILIAFLLWIPSLRAQTPSVELQLDRSEVALNDLLTMVITIKGGSAMTRPEIPSRGNFEVAAQATGNNIEIINGMMSVTNTFTYQLRPLKVGTFSIGPVNAHIDGKTYSAGPARVVVTEAKSKSAPYLVPNPGFPQPSPPSPYPAPQPPSLGPPGTSGQTPEELTFLQSELNKKEAYVGEQILYTFRLYSAVNLQGANLKLPEFKDFIAEELVQQRQYEVTLGNRRYGVNEWRLALIPTNAGKLKTGKASIQARVAVPRRADPFQDPFFQRFPMRMSYEDKTFQASSQSITVKPLPPTNTTFTGLVGKFNLEAHWDRTEIKVGESAHWSITLSGQGNLQSGELPDWPENPLLKVYPATPSLDLKKTDQGLSGKKVFEAAYVGTRPGVAKLDPIELSYFDPVSETYQSLEVPGQTLKIIGNGESEAWVKAGGDQDFPLLEGNGHTGFWATARSIPQVLAAPPWSMHFSFFFYLLLLGMPLTYLLLFLGKKLKERRARPSESRKRSLAYKQAKAGLSQLSTQSREQFLEALPLLLRDYLHQVYDLPEGAFTAREVEAFLQAQQVPVEQVRRLVYMIEQLEQYRYSPNLSGLPLELKTLQNEVLDILKSIEK